jgi:restriction system protein
MQPFKKLFTYWYAVIIYDWTMEFCERWVKSYKLSEQMTGAARSGKQNIVEGSDGMATSLKTGIKLSGVAKHSLEELCADYEDYLRQHDLRQWGKDGANNSVLRRKLEVFVHDLAGFRDEVAAIRGIKAVPYPADPAIAANTLITLCHQATYLLHKQVEALKKKHEREGGLTEELYRRRVEYRRRPL